MPDSIFDERPTAEGIKTLFSQGESLWSATRSNWLRWEDLYDLTFPVWNDKKFSNRPKSRPSTAAFIVDRAVDTYLGYDPSIHRRRNSDSKEDEARADKVEAWLYQALVRTLRKEPQHVGRQLGHYLTKLGYGVLYGPILDVEHSLVEPSRDTFQSDEEYKDALALWEAGREDFSPFILRAPHPSTVVLDPRFKRPPSAVSKTTMFAGDIYFQVEKRKRRRLKSVGDFQRRGDPFEEIEVYE